MREELEDLAELSNDSYIHSPDIEESVFVDFMSYIRSQSLDTRPNVLSSPSVFDIQIQNTSTWTFEMMVTEAFARLLKRFPNVALFHIIFDSYMEKSLKSGEGAVRTAAAGGAITLARIRDDTKVPEQMDKCWASSENKVKFQSYVKFKFQALAREVTKSVILSGVVIDNTLQPATFLTEQGEVQSIFELNFDHEEADFQIIPHIGWDITTFSRKSVTVVSEDTDVLVLLLHYFNSFNATRKGR